MIAKLLSTKISISYLVSFLSVWIFVGFSASIARDFKGAEYRTIESFTYGRFETRIKGPGAEGVLSSLFTYHEISDLSDWNEIDVEVLGRYENSVQFNVISPNRVNHVSSIWVDFGPQNDFHTYAFEWTPDYVAWFIDDTEVYRQTGAHIKTLTRAQKLMMNIWNPVYDNWVGPWNIDVLPVFAYYDWAKYSSHTPGQGNTGTDNNFTLQWLDDFDSWDKSRWQKATHTFEGNNCDFLPDNAVLQDGKLILCLTDKVNTGYTDKNPPVVLWARGYENELILKFSEVVTEESAEKTSNYIISGIEIFSAVLLPGNRKVKLTTSELNPESTYNLIVLGIRDVSADANMLIGGVTKVEMNIERSFPIKINFGNVEYSGYQTAQNWTPETSHGYMDGHDVIWPPGTDIMNTEDDLLYQTERQGLVNYNIRLENGSYDIVFRFSENKFENTGSRIFDIYVEGNKVISNLDVFEKVGKNSACEITVENSGVSDRELNIHFTAITGEVLINAIEIGQSTSSLHGSQQIQNPDYWIAQNYPNPFNSQTTFAFNLSAAGAVRLQVYDARGTLVTTVVDKEYQAGRHRLMHDFAVASGVYFYRFNVRTVSRDHQTIGKMILLK